MKINIKTLCSGSVRQLNSEVTAKRNVRFYAFSLVKANQTDIAEETMLDKLVAADFNNSRANQFDWLESQGFDVVERVITDSEHLEENVYAFEARFQPIHFRQTDWLSYMTT